VPTPTFYGTDSYGHAIYQVIFTGTGGDVQGVETVPPGGTPVHFFPCAFTDDGVSIPASNTAIVGAILAVHMTKSSPNTLTWVLGGRYTSPTYTTPYDSGIGGEGGGWFRVIFAQREDGTPGFVVPFDRADDIFDAGWDWVAYTHNAHAITAFDTDVMTVDDVQLRVLFYYTDAPPDPGGGGEGSPPEPEPPPAPEGETTPGREIDNTVICCANGLNGLNGRDGSNTGGTTGTTDGRPGGETGPILPPDSTNPDATLWQAACGFGGLAPTALAVVNSERWDA